MSSHLGSESFNTSTPGSRSASRSGSSSTSSGRSSKGSHRHHTSGLYGASAALAASNSALAPPSRPAPCPGASLARSASATSNSVRQIASDLISYTKSSAPVKTTSTTANPCKPPCKPMLYISEFEQSLLRANVPIELNETEEITVQGQRGIWANKQEVVNWRGEIPIEDYEINEDAEPEIVTKHTCQRLEYLQEIAIRYLRPPTPPPPGEILINQECNKLTPPAPPLIIRQQPCRPSTPEPLVVREAPPQPPAPICPKVITISGKRLPPPPRKVIIERLAPLPCKPQSVIIERWLPYADLKRRVIFKNNCCPDPVVCKPRNVIVQWEAPCVSIRKEFKYLGVIKANPAEYVQRYGNSLTLSQDLPSFVNEIATPEGLTLAADHKRKAIHELEGDLEALKLVDLDKEGLSEYKDYLAGLGLLKSTSLASIKSAIASLKSSASSHNETAASAVASRPSSNLARSASVSTLPKNTQLVVKVSSSSSRSSSRASQQSSPGAEFTRTTSSVRATSVSSSRQVGGPGSGGSRAQSVASPLRTGSTGNNSSNNNNERSPSDIIEVIFKSIDRSNKGRISVSDAEKILLRLNSRLGRKYGEDDVNAFFAALDVNHDNTIDMDEFKNAFKTLNLV